MKKEELENILTLHLAWLKSEPNGIKANLEGANLYGANLTRANLTRANLERANLYGANLERANLYGANLTRANLENTDFHILQGYFGKHYAYATPEKIKIGCHEKTHIEWLAQYKEIGKKENYSEFEIKMYESFIKMTIAWAKQLPKKEQK